MTSYPEIPAVVTHALDQLTATLAERMRGRPTDDLDVFERELSESLSEVGRVVVGAELERLDPRGEDVKVDGTRRWQAVRSSSRYMTMFGPVSVTRGLYRQIRNGPTCCPMALRAGIVDGFWTPRAAKLAALAVTDMTPVRANRFFTELGGMAPSDSSLDRLPKRLSARWEAQRRRFDARLRAAERVPEEAVTVAVSLDGVLAPIRGPGKAEMKAEMRSQGRPDKGPAGYREVGCGSLSLYDAEGQRLLTRRMGRMPESGKTTLKDMIRVELDHMLKQRPDLRVVVVADGAPDNWTFLESLPHHESVLDFYHAVEHLKRALDTTLGASSIETRHRFEKLRIVLRDRPGGAEAVYQELQRLPRPKGNKTRKYRTGIGYFRRHRHRMNYAELQERNMPIGSGVIEGTCKSLVSDRMKRAGMRWDEAGGQAILTLRAQTQSDRFGRAFRMLVETYRQDQVSPDCREAA